MSYASPPARVGVVGACLVILAAGWFALMRQEPLSADAHGTEGGQVVTQLTETWNGTDIVLTHSCIGSVHTSSTRTDPAPFCLGRSLLTYTDQGGTEATLSDLTVSDPKDAPLLLDARVLSSGIVLISYDQDPCLTAGECAAADPDNHVTLALDLTTGTAHPLLHFPSFGTPIWNADETSAIFLPHTCQGGACTVGPLIGYDLLADAATDLTADQASDKPNVTDANGKIQPTWTDVRWETNAVLATIVYPTGMRKDVKVTR